MKLGTAFTGIFSSLTYAIAATSASELQFRPTDHCCSLLASELPDAVFCPNTTAYANSIESYWSLSVRDLRPNCVVTPRNTNEVSKILRVLSPRSKEDHLCQFAIRGGGHTPFQGGANIDYGITIDMQRINDVKLIGNGSVVQIGAGNKWGKVYATLAPYGLAACGGGADNVGVAGYLTGGGISSFSGRHGWSADTVVNFEIVLASGKIVHANAASNADLFQALKGGSNNLGIVTRFDVEPFEQGELWAGFRSTSIEYFPDTLQALLEHADPANFDPDTTAIVNYLWNQTDGWVIQNILQNSKPVPNPPALRPFTDIPEISSTIAVANLTTAARGGALGYPSNMRFLFGTSTYYPDVALLDSVFGIVNRTLKTVPQDPEFGFKLSYQALPSAMLSNSQGPTPNSFGLDAKIPYLINVRIELAWTDSSKDFYYNRLAERCLSLADLEAKRRGFYHPFMPLTCAGPWQDVIGGYGDKSVKLLREASQKYDPDGVFQLQVPGGFKLGM